MNTTKYEEIDEIIVINNNIIDWRVGEYINAIETERTDSSAPSLLMQLSFLYTTPPPSSSSSPAN